MSRFVHLSRVGRRSLGVALLLACLVAAMGGPSVGASGPALEVAAGQTVRIGDVVPEDVIRFTWDSLPPIARKGLGYTSIDDLRNDQITGPFTLPVFATHPVPVDADDVQDVTPLDESDFPSNAITHEIAAPGVDGGLLSSSNQCTASAKKTNRVHYSQTEWCYDGTLVQPTPRTIKLRNWGVVKWYWVGLSMHKWEGTPISMRKTSGGYGHDHVRDEAKAKVKVTIYAGDNETCYQFNSYLQKQGRGDGTHLKPKGWKGSEGLC